MVVDNNYSLDHDHEERGMGGRDLCRAVAAVKELRFWLHNNRNPTIIVIWVVGLW